MYGNKIHALIILVWFVRRLHWWIFHQIKLSWVLLYKWTLQQPAIPANWYIITVWIGRRGPRVSTGDCGHMRGYGCRGVRDAAAAAPASRLHRQHRLATDQGGDQNRLVTASEYIRLFKTNMYHIDLRAPSIRWDCGQTKIYLSSSSPSVAWLCPLLGMAWTSPSLVF